MSSLIQVEIIKEIVPVFVRKLLYTWESEFELSKKSFCLQVTQIRCGRCSPTSLFHDDRQFTVHDDDDDERQLADNYPDPTSQYDSLLEPPAGPAEWRLKSSPQQ